MRIASSVEYATRVMLMLASLEPSATLSAEKISAAENIPRDYMDQILARLRRSSLVLSRRGAQGGYCLAKAPSAITMGMIVRAVDETVFEQVCDRYAQGE
ncbi:MAG: Rrf2 family transcriptional regulator, partial [Elusimicrobiota bacterium]